MKKAKSSISNGFPKRTRRLSMDDYIEFMNFNHRHFRGNKIAKNDEIAMRVNVPFVIE